MSIPQIHVDRFNSRVDQSGGPDSCWVWTLGLNSSGYGSQWFGNRVLGAHVIAWVMVNGDVPEGMDVCHTCDNSRCCNPAHLFLGTRKDNMRDCSQKGRNGSQIHPESRPRGDSHWTRTNPDRLARGARANAGKGKITAEAVQMIRATHIEGVASQKAIGEAFGISQTQVGRIVRGERWGWLDA